MAAHPHIDLPYPGEHVDIDAIYSEPAIDPTAWIAPNAVVNGRVRIGARATVWYNCVLRGDGEFIDVGDETNIQDGSILHVDFGYPCILGKRVTLGHNAIVHGSVVKDGALIGIAATVLSQQVKELSSEQRERLSATFKHYVNNGAVYRARYG